jgi:hypothetical protein
LNFESILKVKVRKSQQTNREHEEILAFIQVKKEEHEARLVEMDG